MGNRSSVDRRGVNTANKLYGFVFDLWHSQGESGDVGQIAFNMQDGSRYVLSMRPQHITWNYYDRSGTGTLIWSK